MLFAPNCLAALSLIVPATILGLLLACGATVWLISARGRKTVPLSILFSGNLLAWIAAAQALPSFPQFAEIAVLGTALPFLLLGAQGAFLIALLVGLRSRGKSPESLPEQQIDPVEERDQLAGDIRSDGIWDWDIPQNRAWFSPQMCALLGLPREALSSDFQTWEKRLHQEDHKSTIETMERHLAENTDYDIQYRLRSQNDEYRWFRARGRFIKDSEGKALRMIGSLQDIHLQHEAAENEADNNALFEAIFNRAHIGIALATDNGTFAKVNNALCEMLGYDREALLARSIHTITRGEDSDKSDEIKEQLENGKAGHMQLENRYIQKNGDVIHAITGVSRLDKPLGPKKAQHLIHIQDVTDLKKAERKAIESSEFKSQFLAHMSHEIRTPLSGLLGMIDLARGTELTDEQQHYLGSARHSSEQLMLLINDILDLSKIEAGKLEIVTNAFDLRASVEKMMPGLALRAHEKNLEIAYRVDDSLPDRLVGDWNRINQIFSNLIGNAVKFTQKGQIVLELKRDRGRSENTATEGATQGSTKVMLVGTVSDTGIGIPSNKLRDIFEAFHHADSSIPQKYGGTGLGLAITQELIHLMGGRISVDSEVGAGSKFTIQLPLEALPHDLTEGSVVTERNFENLRALILDDNATSLELISRVLSKWKIQPTGFADAQAALSFLENQPPNFEKYDLCFVDNRIPGNEALELPEQLGAYLKHQERVVMLLSSPNRERETKRCRLHGLPNQLLKPVSVPQLGAMLDQLLGEAATPASTSEQQALRILLAEDSPINSEVALHFITKFGHQVDCVENGKEAVAALEKEEYDIVLMDIQMPEMNGLEATKIIRDKEEGSKRHQWIIALTAQAMKGDREECLSAGMDDYISKPIKRDELQNAILRADITPVKTTHKRVEPLPEANADPSQIIQAFEGEINVAKKVGQIFLETSPQLWETLNRSIEFGDAKSLRTTAHRLKGSFMQFGAEEAERIAQQLEFAGKNGQFDGLEERVLELQDHIRDLKKQIYQLLRH